MLQQIKVVRISHWMAGNPQTSPEYWAEEEILTAWESVTSPDGVRPALEGVYPLGDGLVLLVFSGDLAWATTAPRRVQAVAP